MGSFRKRLLVLIIGLVIVTQTVTLAAVLASTAHNVEARAAEPGVDKKIGNISLFMAVSDPTGIRALDEQVSRVETLAKRYLQLQPITPTQFDARKTYFLGDRVH